MSEALFMKYKFKERNGWLVSLFCILSCAVFISYCFGNPTGHGQSQLTLLYVSIPALIYSIVGWHKVRFSSYLLAISSAYTSIAYSAITHHLLIMRGYESWAKAGLPDPPEYRLTILYFFSAALMINLVLVLISMISRSRRS